MALRRIVGNLDCEVSFARVAARRRWHGETTALRGEARFGLPVGVERRISAYATLLRVFAREGDRLWTPLAVDVARVPEVAGLECPVLESGEVGELPGCSETLAWGETEEVESLTTVRPPAKRAPPSSGALLSELVWAVDRAPPAAAREVNHRGVSLEIARTLDLSLEGAKLLRSVGELEVHLGQGGARASPTESWVLKAPFSAAGRSRLLQRGRELAAGARRRIERLLELHGELLFEPWMTRTEDFGCCVILDDRQAGGWRDLGVHGLEVDPGGGFRGVVLPARGGASDGLTSRERELLDRVVTAVAGHLRGVGYCGPVGIDCWRYRDATGAVKFHPLGEINARMSFGLIGRALLEQLTRAGTLGAEDTVRLRLGKKEELRRPVPVGTTVLPLLLPSAVDSGAAWLEF